MSLETDFAALIILLLTSEKQVRQDEAGGRFSASCYSRDKEMSR